MKNLYYIIALTCIITIASSAPANGSAENRSLPDSLITDNYVYEYTFSDFDKAVNIMKELRKRKSYPQSRLDEVEGDLYFNTGKYLHALKFYKQVLENDSIHNNDIDYMDHVHRMISCYDCLHDESKKANYVRLLLNKAEQCNNMEMKSIALFNMGKMIYYQEDRQRGYQMIHDAISLMKQTNYKYKYDNLRYNYHTLLIMQQRDRRYEDALQTLEELEKIVVKTTHKEPAIEGMAEKELKTMYAQRATVLSRLGRIQEAEKAYQSWKSIGDAYSKDDYLIVPYLMDRKQYDKIINMYIPREQFLYTYKDTINYHMIAVKRSLGKAYEMKNDYKRAAKYFEELAILTDSLKKREQKSSAMELATVYETHEQNAKLEKQNKRIEIRNIMLISTGGVLLLLLVLFIRNKQYTRTIRQKNIAMIKTIHDTINYKEKYYELLEKTRITSESNAIDIQNNAAITDSSNTIQIPTGNPINKENNNWTDEEKESHRLFEKLDSTVTREKLFLNPDLSREELMKLVHVNKNRFGKILQENVHMTTTGYINNKRLEYAVKLLMDAPNFTITAIAEASGLPNIPTFNRLFRNKFGMTPSEYRNSIKTSDNVADIDLDGQNDSPL